MLEFYRGKRNQYPTQSEILENSSGTSHPLLDAIYFAEDTHEILVNGEAFGLDADVVTNVNVVDTTLTFTYKEGSVTKTKNIELGLNADTQAAITELQKLLDENGQLQLKHVYESKLDDGIKTVTALGGIAANTKVSDLKDKEISEILDMLIFPTVQPTKVDHTVTIERKTGVAEIKEVGAESWVADDFNITTTVGEIRINGKKTQNYTGAASNPTVNNVPVTMTYGTKTVNATATFAAGPVPLDSKGGVANTTFTQFTGGTKTSTNLTLYVAYPIYANNNNITEFTKQNLVKPKSVLKIDYKAAAVGDDVHTLKVYAPVKTFAMYDEEQKSYIAVTNWVEAEQETINGVSYHVYKTEPQGASNYQFTF